MISFKIKICFLHSGFFRKKYEHLDEKKKKRYNTQNKKFPHVENNNGLPWSLNSSQLLPSSRESHWKEKLKSFLKSHYEGLS